jgi:hypothetical protein
MSFLHSHGIAPGYWYAGRRGVAIMAPAELELEDVVGLEIMLVDEIGGITVDILEVFWRLFCPPFQLSKLSLNGLKAVLTMNTPLQKCF